MPSDQDDWVRLPGLFRWEEVSEVFATAAGFDDEWRFDVRAVRCEGDQVLYVVHAAPSRHLASARVSNLTDVLAGRKPIEQALGAMD